MLDSMDFNEFLYFHRKVFEFVVAKNNMNQPMVSITR